jgi:hypothetical protein
MFTAAALAYRNSPEYKEEKDARHADVATFSETVIPSSPSTFLTMEDHGRLPPVEGFSSIMENGSAHGWSFLRKEVKENRNIHVRKMSPTTEHLQERAVKLKKLVKEVEVEHVEKSITYNLELPDYTENSLPTRCAIESQMKSHKQIVESAIKGVNTQPPEALNWMLKRTKERMADKLPGVDLCKTIKHHSTRDQLISLRRKQIAHDKRIKRAKKCVSSRHKDSFVLLHLAKARKKRRMINRRDRTSRFSKRGRKRRSELPMDDEHVSLVLPAMEANIFHKTDDRAMHRNIRGKTPGGPMRLSTSSGQFPRIERKKGRRRKRRHRKKASDAKTIHNKLMNSSYSEPFLTRDQYSELSKSSHPRMERQKENLQNSQTLEEDSRRRQIGNSSTGRRDAPAPSFEETTRKNNNAVNPESEVDNLLKGFGQLSTEAKHEYLQRMKQDLIASEPRT